MISFLAALLLTVMGQAAQEISSEGTSEKTLSAAAMEYLDALQGNGPADDRANLFVLDFRKGTIRRIGKSDMGTLSFKAARKRYADCIPEDHYSEYIDRRGQRTFVFVSEWACGQGEDAFSAMMLLVVRGETVTEVKVVESTPAPAVVEPRKDGE